MKILKEKSRVYNGKPYYKYKINIPEETLEKSGFKEGDILSYKVKRGEMIIRKKKFL